MFFFGYLALLVLISVVAILISVRAWTSLTQHGDTTSSRSNVLQYLAGATFSILLTLIAAWAVPAQGSNDWIALFFKAAITLALPITLGVLLTARWLTKQRRVFVLLGIGSLHATLVAPFVVLGISQNYYKIVNYPAFYRLCKSAQVAIHSQIDRPKGVALLPDMYFLPSKHRQTEHRPIGSFLLNQSLLEFIERSQPVQGAANATVTYERLSKDRENRSASLFKSVRVDSLMAEYEVRATDVPLPNDVPPGIGGSRIEVRRRADNHLIAVAQYFWDNRGFRACPEEVRNDLFVPRFLMRALNVNGPANGL
jgi:hypothetical protein